MDSKKSPKGRKRVAKGGSNDIPEEEGAWDCSVCTFKNKAEAFKCSMCDVRKGTSTRKPRINPDLVPASSSKSSNKSNNPQAGSSKDPDGDSEEDAESDKSDSGSATQASTPQPPPAPTPPKSAKKSTTAKKSSAAQASNSEASNSTPKKSTAANKAKLKNVDRSSATYHSVTVDDFTVVITEFKPKIKKSPVKNGANAASDKSDTKNGDHDKNTTDNAGSASEIKLEQSSSASANGGDSGSSRTS